MDGFGLQGQQWGSWGVGVAGLCASLLEGGRVWQRPSSQNSPAQPCPFRPQSLWQSNRTRHDLPSPTHPLIYFNYPLPPTPLVFRLFLGASDSLRQSGDNCLAKEGCAVPLQRNSHFEHVPTGSKSQTNQAVYVCIHVNVSVFLSFLLSFHFFPTSSASPPLGSHSTVRDHASVSPSIMIIRDPFSPKGELPSLEGQLPLYNIKFDSRVSSKYKPGVHTAEIAIRCEYCMSTKTKPWAFSGPVSMTDLYGKIMGDFTDGRKREMSLWGLWPKIIYQTKSSHKSLHKGGFSFIQHCCCVKRRLTQNSETSQNRSRV